MTHFERIKEMTEEEFVCWLTSQISMYRISSKFDEATFFEDMMRNRDKELGKEWDNEDEIALLGDLEDLKTYWDRLDDDDDDE